MSPPNSADKKLGGIERPMQDAARSTAAIPLQRPTGWLQWAGRHPGMVLLGALAMALLALRESPRAEALECDASDEEVPLFI